MVTYLILANMTIYICDILEMELNIYAKRKKYFGQEIWTAVSHLSAPLCLLYRFHSSVALADIWSSAYRPCSQEWLTKDMMTYH